MNERMNRSAVEGEAMEFDLVIANGWIVDGMSPSICRGSIGIQGDKVACICADAAHLPGKKVIDAGEHIVAPGFVDVHSHADHFLLLDPAMKNKLMQGVTTEIGGNCGSSAFPWNDAHQFHLPGMEEQFGWSSFAGFLEAVERRGIGVNFGSLIGFESLWRGFLKNRDSSNGDVKKLEGLLAMSLEEGALGLSVGEGAPAHRQLKQAVLRAFCDMVAKSGGVLSAHLYSEASGMPDALSDTISLAAESGASLQISHFKALDRFNWPKQETALGLIEKLHASGMDISIDCFPYTECCSPLRVLMPPHLATNGDVFAKSAKSSSARSEIERYLAMHFPGPETYRSLACPHLENPKYRDLQGLDLLTAAVTAGVEPGALVLDLARAEGLDRFTYYDCICRENMRAAIALDCAMVASDSFPTGDPKYFRNSIIHPRTFGAFPEYLSEFVYKNHVFDLPAAIKKITSLPARKFGLRGRGVLGAGAFADITIFDPENLRPGASTSEPSRPPSGIEYVIVNGQIAMEHGEFMEVYAGKALRRGE